MLEALQLHGDLDRSDKKPDPEKRLVPLLLCCCPFEVLTADSLVPAEMMCRVRLVVWIARTNLLEVV